MESAVNWSREDAQALCAAWSQIKHTSIFSWSKKEVHALLVYWADPSVQQDLLLKVRNDAVYNSLSAKLASLGFNKSAQECKDKIKKLKQNYRRIKKRQNMGWSRTTQFGILDEAPILQPAASKCSEALTSSESSHPVATDVETNLLTQEAEWLPDEVQVLVTLWAQPNIQEQLLTSGGNSDVFTYLSNELALVSFNKTPQQCRVKVNKLIEEHKKILQAEPNGTDQSDWFVIMDGVLGPDGETSKETNSTKDSSQAVWTSDEVDVLLTRWAEEHVQERLAGTQEDERVYAQLSSELATQGFDKTTYQCRTKVMLLKQEYERIREQNDSKVQESSWFALMDDVYSRAKAQTVGKPAVMVTKSESGSVLGLKPGPPEPAEGCRLSIPSLCLLVPTIRLMSAFAWQVVQCCNVVHYRKVEELVVLVTELAPELLTARERVQLLLRLRARLVLELCRSESTATLLNIQPHLDIILNLRMSSGCDQEDFEELENSKTNFVEGVQTLFEDSKERTRFFTEVFPILYGQQYEATLQTLVWKFISRLDSLLPIPDIKQTAEWLSSAPSVLEKCGQLVLEREQLKEVLDFHQQQTKYKCFSQTQNMFLPVLFPHPKTSSHQEVSPTSDDEGFDFGKEPSEGNQTEPVVNDSGKRSDDGKTPQSEGSESSHLHYCSKCSYSVGQVSDLLQHIRQTHLIQKPGPFHEAGGNIFGNDITPMRGTTDSGEKICEVSKGTPSSNSHGPPFQCDKCDKKYLSKSKLIIHNRIHTGEKPFLCSTCGKGFRTSYGLESHSRTHTGNWRYKCNICGKTSIQQMARHMRMHRGEKNYLCSECGKAFLSSGELRLHMRYHTGEKPYTCKQCGKGFIAKCHLTCHTRQHTGEKPYRCSLCPKTFSSLKDKKRHLKIHTHKKSFQCLKCGRIFRQEDTFKLHVETHHLT
uniref:C2H2-type domain-containing protein n=1 Tax=Iconisemion striatum TaxID=60296 RepID=A0A1A7WQS0_9TELE